MVRKLFAASLVAVLGGFAVAAEIKSGPQAGEKLAGPFHPLNVNGESAGKKGAPSSPQSAPGNPRTWAGSCPCNVKSQSTRAAVSGLLRATPDAGQTNRLFEGTGIKKCRHACCRSQRRRRNIFGKAP